MPFQLEAMELLVEGTLTMLATSRMRLRREGVAPALKFGPVTAALQSTHACYANLQYLTRAFTQWK